MKAFTIMGTAAVLAMASAVPAVAQDTSTSGAMQNGGSTSTPMASSTMSSSQMAAMNKCQAMSSDAMMKNKKCAAMAKMHPEMMSGGGSMAPGTSN